MILGEAFRIHFLRSDSVDTCLSQFEKQNGICRDQPKIHVDIYSLTPLYFGGGKSPYDYNQTNLERTRQKLHVMYINIPTILEKDNENIFEESSSDHDKS